jgi:tryptophanyl-tRNA synthetase
VPVGKDQEQHLELSRNIAQRFNQVVGRDYFVLPECLFTEVPKVMSTADPLKKMSASLGPKHHINVFSDADVIRKQIKSAVTDSGDTPAGQISPGVENLFSMLQAAGGHPDLIAFREQALAGTLQYGKLKEAVADVIIRMTDTFRENRKDIVADQKAYQERIAASSEVVRKKAQKTISEVKDLIGLMNVKM